MVQQKKLPKRLNTIIAFGSCLGYGSALTLTDSHSWPFLIGENIVWLIKGVCRDFLKIQMSLITHWGFYLVTMLDKVFYFGSFAMTLIRFPKIDTLEFIKNFCDNFNMFILFIINKNHATVLKSQRKWSVND